MRISVIVCTRNRASAIIQCLKSIEDSLMQSLPIQAEIVIVDNGSTDNTATLLKFWAAQCRFPVNLQMEQKPGVAKARNRGLRAAKGELLVFIDDDCLMQIDYISHALKHDMNDREPILRGGSVELGNPTDLPLTIITDPTTRQWKRSLRSARNDNLGNCLLGCNMTMGRGVFNRIGLFDENLGTGSYIAAGEDTDYLFRCYLAGVTIEYAPDIVVFHHHGRRHAGEGYKLFKNYMIGSGALYAKYIFKDPTLCLQFYWDLKNAIRDAFSKRPSGNILINFSNADRVIYAIKGAAMYIFLICKGAIGR